MSLTDRQNSHLYNPTRFAPIFHTKKRKRKINSFFNTKCLFFFLFLFLITIFNSHTEFKYAIYIKNLKSFSNSISLSLSLSQSLTESLGFSRGKLRYFSNFTFFRIPFLFGCRENAGNDKPNCFFFY